MKGLAQSVVDWLDSRLMETHDDFIFHITSSAFPWWHPFHHLHPGICILFDPDTLPHILSPLAIASHMHTHTHMCVHIHIHIHMYTYILQCGSPSATQQRIKKNS